MTKQVDAHLASELRLVFEELLEHTHKNVVLDFSETLNLDTSGVGAIVYLFKRLHSKGLTLELTGLERQALRKIKRLHLNETIKTSKKIIHREST
jgi:anti-anti-sigma factor